MFYDLREGLAELKRLSLSDQNFCGKTSIINIGIVSGKLLFVFYGIVMELVLLAYFFCFHIKLNCVFSLVEKLVLV